MRDAERRADFYQMENERLKNRVAELTERLEAAGDVLSGERSER